MKRAKLIRTLRDVAITMQSETLALSLVYLEADNGRDRQSTRNRLMDVLGDLLGIVAKSDMQDTPGPDLPYTRSYLSEVALVLGAALMVMRELDRTPSETANAEAVQ